MVSRLDGKLVNVGRKFGQLFVCAQGCCCGDTVHGACPVPTQLYHTEWERRKLRPHVHLSLGGCLGPCTLANVALLFFDGRPIWFHSMDDERRVLALYDYIEAMVDAQAYLPPPPALAELVFNGFSWGDDGGRSEELRGKPDSRVGNGFVILTHADTDLLALRSAVESLESDFPPVRAHNIAHLRSEADARAFVDAVVPDGEIVILRLLGGRSSFRGGFERVVELAQEHDQWLICLPGTDTLDPELTAASNVSVPVVHEAFAYLQLGGLKNVEHLLRFLSDHLLATGYGFDAPEPQRRHGVYWRTDLSPDRRGDDGAVRLGLLFYRSHLLSGNTAFVDAIVEAAERQGARITAVYTASLQDHSGEDGADGPVELPTALRFFMENGAPNIDVLITTTSFAIGSTEPRTDGPGDGGATDPLLQLGVPIVQAIAATGRRDQWEASSRGLSPTDTAMNVAIPELDGRIISVPVSFKADLDATDRPTLYEPDPERIERVVGQALRLAALRHKPNFEKRVAFLLTDYNARASRVAAAVGLDTPASLLRMLQAMQAAGYDVRDLPTSSDELVQRLIDFGSYDRETQTAAQLERSVGRVGAERYAAWFSELPAPNQDGMRGQWGAPPGRYYVDRQGHIALAGLELGNAFVAIQPPRGYGMDPSAIYHQPGLPPPHPYHALYRWLSEPTEQGGWGADAIVHVGKHGTLEWLPGKGVGLSRECYPDLFLGDLPLIYPFIINDPGEGAQAKRRSHAVIVDHLTPPMTTAEGYGEIEELTRLVDEYYQLEQLDPSKLPLLQQQIWSLIREARLDADLGQLLNRDSQSHTHAWDPQFHEDGVPYTISDLGARDFAHLVENINGYLCELTSAQIRDGLHVLGQPPVGEQLVDTLLALVRLPNLEVPSLRAGVADAFGIRLEEVLDDLGARANCQAEALSARVGRPLPTNADVLEAIDHVGRELLIDLAEGDFRASEEETFVSSLVILTGAKDLGAVSGFAPGSDLRHQAPSSAPVHSPSAQDYQNALRQTLRFVCEFLAPALWRTDEELGAVLAALEGRYVAAGPSGAPTRGMAHVLPTGRNFYTVDPRALPSMAAWQVGQQLADELIARYVQDEGSYPQRVGISIWGTSLMRTHGDDVAEVMALIGVRPRWQAESRRLVGFDVIPLSELGRPRVDVLCRISGFFRDAFPDLIALLDHAFQAIGALDEPLDQNPIRRAMLAEHARLSAQGVETERAAREASFRIFGSPPGAYGAGILHLIDERNWRTDADLAAVYVNWGGYAYGVDIYGVDARDAFQATLAGVEAAIKNQDNREHDIFDSDDYFQYHGGMIAAIRSLSGANPRRYFGDSADPQRARVRDLKEESLRVFRSRVVNPKWIQAIMRHGFKGALELAATVDYLFGYDATSGVVDDWMYERVTRAYALDPAVQQFFRESNPWALRDMAARLLEAIERGLWAEPSPEIASELQSVYLTAESDIEARFPPSLQTT